MLQSQFYVKLLFGGKAPRSGGGALCPKMTWHCNLTINVNKRRSGKQHMRKFVLCLYTVAVGDTLDKLRLQRFHQKVATSTRFVQPETFVRRHQLPSTIASVFTSRCKYGRGNQGLVHSCIHRILAGKQ